MVNGDDFKAIEDKRVIMKDMPIIVRIDGKGFHNWTKGLDRPFDATLSGLMRNTTLRLATATNAMLAYTQSDEISLLWHPTGKTQPIFGGKVQKIASILASMTTGIFNESRLTTSLAWKGPAFFDARVFNVGFDADAVDYFQWRYEDALKNAISMAAHEQFSHKNLQGKHSAQMIQMLADEGIVFDEYPQHFRRGTFYKRVIEPRVFSVEELVKLPPQHEAHTNPNLMVERSKTIEIFPPENSQLTKEWIYG